MIGHGELSLSVWLVTFDISFFFFLISTIQIYLLSNKVGFHLFNFQ